MAITSTSFGQASNSTNPTITFGFTASAGDLIVIGAAQDGAGVHAWASPWVRLFTDAHTGFSYSCAYLIAAGGETQTTAVSTAVSDRWEVVIFRIPAGEWHGTTPPEASTPVEGSSAAPNAGAINASWVFDTGNIAITFAARDDSVANTITAYPANYGTAQIDKNDVTSAANIGGAARTDAADNEDAGAFTISASETWAAWTVAVRPAVSVETHTGTITATGGGVATIVSKKISILPLTATGAGVLTFAKATVRTRAITATGGGILTFAKATVRTRAITATGGGTFVAFLQKIGLRAITGTGGGILSSVRAKIGLHAITATGGGVATITATSVFTETHSGTITATGGGVASIAKAKVAVVSIGATGAGAVQFVSMGRHTATVAATGGGVAFVAGAGIRAKTVSATGGGVAVVTAKKVGLRAVDATGGGVASLAYVTIRLSTFAATGGGRLTLTSGGNETHEGTLLATGGGTGALIAFGIRTAVLGATGGGGAQIGTRKVGLRSVSATGGGAAAFSSTTRRDLALTGTGGGGAEIGQFTIRFKQIAGTGGGRGTFITLNATEMPLTQMLEPPGTGAEDDEGFMLEEGTADIGQPGRLLEV